MTTIGIILTLTSIIGGFFAARKIRTYITTAHTTTPQPQPQDYTQPAPQPEPPQPQQQEQPEVEELKTRFEVGHTYEGVEKLFKPRSIYQNGRRIEVTTGETWLFEVVGRNGDTIQGHAGEGYYFDIEAVTVHGMEYATYYSDNGRKFIICSENAK